MNKKEKKQLLANIRELTDERINININIWLKSKIVRFIMLLK